MSDKPNSPRLDSFIARVIGDPAQPTEAILLNGFLGNSSEPGHTRLYIDASLSQYVDVPTDAILHSEPLGSAVSPLGGSYVWLKKDAEVLHGKAGTDRLRARFLEGPISAAFTGAAAGAGLAPIAPATVLCPSEKICPTEICHTQLAPCPTHLQSVCIACPTPACPTHAQTACIACPSAACPTHVHTACAVCPTHIHTDCPICPTEAGLHCPSVHVVLCEPLSQRDAAGAQPAAVTQTLACAHTQQAACLATQTAACLHTQQAICFVTQTLACTHTQQAVCFVTQTAACAHTLQVACLHTQPAVCFVTNQASCPITRFCPGNTVLCPQVTHACPFPSVGCGGGPFGGGGNPGV
jgi:hypothetical protein